MMLEIDEIDEHVYEVTPETYDSIVKDGVLAGSLSIQEETEHSDIDIVIHMDTLPEELYNPTMDLLEYMDEYWELIEKGTVEGVWISLKIKAEGYPRVLNAIVCMDAFSYGDWTYAAVSVPILKEHYPLLFNGSRLFRVTAYEMAFRANQALRTAGELVCNQKHRRCPYR